MRPYNRVASFHQSIVDLTNDFLQPCQFLVQVYVFLGVPFVNDRQTKDPVVAQWLVRQQRLGHREIGNSRLNQVNHAHDCLGYEEQFEHSSGFALGQHDQVLDLNYRYIAIGSIQDKPGQDLNDCSRIPSQLVLVVLRHMLPVQNHKYVPVVPVYV